MVVAICATGGVLSCMLLAGLLMVVGKSFLGIYGVLAWVIAFFAGYLVSVPIAYAIWIGWRLHNRFAHSMLTGPATGIPPNSGIADRNR